ncbi:unnamed protein product, partial [Polarella glacialis]
DSKLTRVHAVLRGVQHVAQSSAEKVSGNSRLDDFVAEAQNAADVLGCVATQCREAGLDGESQALRTASAAALQDLVDAAGALAGQRCGGVTVGTR